LGLLEQEGALGCNVDVLVVGRVQGFICPWETEILAAQGVGEVPLQGDSRLMIDTCDLWYFSGRIPAWPVDPGPQVWDMNLAAAFASCRSSGLSEQETCSAQWEEVQDSSSPPRKP